MTIRSIRPSANEDRLREYVHALPPRRSRIHHPESIAAADALILDRFERYGWRAEPRPFAFRNVAGFDDAGTLRRGSWGPMVYPAVAGVNVVGRLEGREPRSMVAVVAHHDSPRDLPGADDNAAGVAVLLELARLLEGMAPRRTILLAAVDMEEIGMFGSRALVAELAATVEIRGAIVFDTIAYTDPRPGAQLLPPGIGLLYPGLVRRLRHRGLRGDWTGVIHRGTSRSLAESFGDALVRRVGSDGAVLLRDPGDLPVVGPVLRRTLPMVREFARSDHRSFWDAGVPAIVVTDTTYFRNPHYHDLTDTPETLDYARLAAITEATAEAVVRFAEA